MKRIQLRQYSESYKWKNDSIKTAEAFFCGQPHCQIKDGYKITLQQNNFIIGIDVLCEYVSVSGSICPAIV